MARRARRCLLAIAFSLLCLTASSTPVRAFTKVMYSPAACIPHETVGEFVSGTEIILWGRLKQLEYEDGYWKVTLDNLDPVKGIPAGAGEFVFYIYALDWSYRLSSLEELPFNAVVIGKEEAQIPHGDDPTGKEWLTKSYAYRAVLKPKWHDINRIMFTGKTVRKTGEPERNIQSFFPGGLSCRSYDRLPTLYRIELDMYLVFYKFGYYIACGGVASILAGWLFYRRLTYRRRNKTI